MWQIFAQGKSFFNSSDLFVTSLFVSLFKHRWRNISYFATNTFDIVQIILGWTTEKTKIKFPTVDSSIFNDIRKVL